MTNPQDPNSGKPADYDPYFSAGARPEATPETPNSASAQTPGYPQYDAAFSSGYGLGSDYSAPGGGDYPAPGGVPPIGQQPYRPVGMTDEPTLVQSATASQPGSAAGFGPNPQPGASQPMSGQSASDASAQRIWPAAPARTKRRPGTLLVTAALAATIGAGAGIGAYALAGGDGGGFAPIQISTQQAANAPKLDGTVSAAAKQIEPSVVTITVQSGQGGGIGTGVVLDKDGHILTNDHVVSEGSGQDSQIRVAFDDGTTAEAKVLGTSATNDLAVIKVAASDKLVPADFAKSDSLDVGQAVVAVGAPLGLSDTVTSGIVSSVARPVRSGTTNDAVYLAVQTDAAINPGNSGGPLVNLNGSVVGINSSIASTSSDQSGGQSGNIGIGFAIPSDVAIRVATQLIQTGEYKNAALGVTVGGQDSAAVSTTGVALGSVNSDGAAAKAGLESGDQVTKINNFVTTTADGLIAATRFYAPGTTVEVTYTRNGQPHTAQVTLGEAQ